MSLTASEVWKRLLDRARQDIPEQTFRTWLEPTEALGIDGNIISIGVPDQFAADWNESKHAELFTSYGPIALGHPIQVVFKVNEERKKRSQMDFFVTPSSTATRSQTSIIQAPLSPRYTFDHFVIGKSNELAAAAAHAVTQAPGKVYNPLFIYGDTGLGKTHLMQAVAHEMIAKHPQIRITFVGTEQFTNELITSIQNHTTSNFRRQFRETDLLLVDDIHFLKGKEATQQEFFHTFNALYEAGRQIVLTSEQGREDGMITNRAFFKGLQCHALLAHVDGEYGYVCRRYAADTGDLSDGFGSYFF
jgi:chromosomal replication initiator protein